MNDGERKATAESQLCSNLPQNTPQIIIYPSFESPQIVEQTHFPAFKKPRKKRTNSPKIFSGEGDGVTAAILKPKPKSSWKKPDPSAPKITRPCSECGKTFWSWKALFGHMRCHPERQWRGINPPPNYLRPAPAPPTPISHQSNAHNVEEEALVVMTDDDQEVATCLLMLANGPTTTIASAATSPAAADPAPAPLPIQNQGTFQCDRASDMEAVLDGEDGDGDVAGALGVGSSSCRFECSSCKKVFGSHQALGGHRASHKNVKGCFAITRNDTEEDENPLHPSGGGGDDKAEAELVCKDTHSMLMMFGHQCSICLRVFSSGQALGGHKRCHWEKAEDSVTLSPGLNSPSPYPPYPYPYPFAVGAAAPATHASATSKESCGTLDLNLPAPLPDDSSSSSHSSGLALDLRLGL